MRWIVAFLGMFLALMAAGCAQEKTVVDTMGGETTTMTATAVTTEPATETTMTATVEVPAVDSTETAAEVPAADSTATTGTATADKEVPKTHNVDHGGVMHAPGSDNPTQRCAACHGKDLRGAKVAAVSCYDCHDQVW
ncbi:MAG: hypothetical protein ABR517_03315 [Thermoanaerobaculia bacterium]